VTAVVRLATGATLVEQDVTEHCTRQLGSFEVPKNVVLLDVLPVNATGKSEHTDYGNNWRHCSARSDEAIHVGLSSSLPTL
jgi:acyl-CoA synthetase (AMP-forming)/AMP-acid ligase II